MQDKQIAALKDLSGQTLFTTTMVKPQTQLARPQTKAINQHTSAAHMAARAFPARGKTTMSAASVPAMNKFVLGKLSNGSVSTLEPASGFNMGYMPMTSSSLERTLAAVSDQVSLRAKELRLAAQGQKVAATTAHTAAKEVHQTYGEAKTDIVSQLLKHQEGKYQVANPYAFLSNKEPGLSLVADNRYQMAMEAAAQPMISHDGEVNVIEKHMEQEITDYATAKTQVKQSMLQRMVGPAFAASVLAAAATLMPFPAGAEQLPSFLSDAGLNPSVISAEGTITFRQYIEEFAMNAAISGILASSTAYAVYVADYKREHGETEKPRTQQTA